MAIIIDVVHDKGRIRIYKKDSDNHIDGVGIEWTRHKVMVPWNNNWWFRASGSLPVRYIIK
nr:hypothetical protein CPAG_05271 [Coccidioides posadasii RMSCC 3488]